MGALGLTDTINANLTSGNTNLDIHMQKKIQNMGAMWQYYQHHHMEWAQHR